MEQRGDTASAMSYLNPAGIRFPAAGSMRPGPTSAVSITCGYDRTRANQEREGDIY